MFYARDFDQLLLRTGNVHLKYRIIVRGGLVVALLPVWGVECPRKLSLHMASASGFISLVLPSRWSPST